MNRALYEGRVRNGAAELERDERMLALSEQGVAVAQIAQRMGLTANAVRMRIKRARQQRGVQAEPTLRSAPPPHSGEVG